MSGLCLLRRLPLVLLVYGFALQTVANGWGHAFSVLAPICHAGPLDAAGPPQAPGLPVSHDCIAGCVLSCGDAMPSLPPPATVAIPMALPIAARGPAIAAVRPAGRLKLAAVSARGPPSGA